MKTPSDSKPSRVREDLRQFVSFAAGYGVVLVLGYLLLRKINLTLSQEQMGVYSYTFALVNILMPVFYLAAPQAYIRFHDEHRVSAGLRKMLRPLFWLSSVGVAVIVWLKTGSFFALMLASYPFFNERLFVFRSQMRTSAVNAMKICEIAVPLSVLCAIPLFPGAFGGVTIDAGAVLGLYGIGFATAFLFPLKLAPASHPGRGTVAKFLLPIVFTSLVAALVENLSVVMTKAVLGYEAAAQMGVAARNLIFIRALFSVFMMFYPVVYFREMANRRFGAVRLYRVVILAVGSAFVGGMVVFTPLVYSLTGANAYVGTGRVFQLLALGMLCDFVFEIFALYFQHEIKTWKATLVKIVFLALLAAGFAVVVANPPFLSSRMSPLVALAATFFAASAISGGVGTAWAVIAEFRSRRAVA